MSTILAEILEVNEVTLHPNADRLDLVRIGGAITSRPRGTVAAGDRVVYFPPNLLIPETVAQQLGVKQYLKHAVYPGDTEKTQCRVAACRLRGVASFGFAATIEEAYGTPFVDYYLQHSDRDDITGIDVSATFRAVKYEPPIKLASCDVDADHPLFHRYTDIGNFYRYPNTIPLGTPIRATEKIHGTQVRYGYIDGEFEAGTNYTRLKKPTEKSNRYWATLADNVKEMLVSLAGESGLVPAIVFGEIFGPGVQDMDYGVPKGKRGFRVFDISINGRYLDWKEVDHVCRAFGVETVPLLYIGDFDPTMLDMLTQGLTEVGPSTGKFKGREGVVVAPLREAFAADLPGGRRIIKYVGADYLDRKGAQDNA